MGCDWRMHMLCFFGVSDYSLPSPLQSARDLHWLTFWFPLLQVRSKDLAMTGQDMTWRSPMVQMKMKTTMKKMMKTARPSQSYPQPPRWQPAPNITPLDTACRTRLVLTKTADFQTVLLGFTRTLWMVCQKRCWPRWPSLAQCSWLAGPPGHQQNSPIRKPTRIQPRREERVPAVLVQQWQTSLLHLPVARCLWITPIQTQPWATP